jgi:2-polyprenyl-3-methyl-5-hydroxy-6-metoxy-1,4-benzoquinol methylase
VAGVDFEGWIDYVEELLKMFDSHPRWVLDLACGTGNTVIPFSRRGYHALGMDLSPEMIGLARAKALEAGLEIEFMVGDIRDYRLARKVDLVTCFHDGLNYMLTEEDLFKAFRSVSRCLVEGGMFIFDLNAISWIGADSESPVVIEEPDLTILYETVHDRGKNLWRIALTGFAREGELYRKFVEQHVERGYQPARVEELLKNAGLEPKGVFDAFTFAPVHPGSRRHFYAARKNFFMKERDCCHV